MAAQVARGLMCDHIAVDKQGNYGDVVGLAISKQGYHCRAIILIYLRCVLVMQ